MASLIEWQDSYSVGVKLIDEQHGKLFSHINNLFLAMTENRGEQELGILLDELSAYVNYHFSTEEKYFDEFNYPKKDEHVLQHKQFVEKIQSFKKAHAEHKDFLAFEVIDFLEDWILGHVLREDKKYTKLFNDNGLK